MLLKESKTLMTNVIKKNIKVKAFCRVNDKIYLFLNLFIFTLIYLFLHLPSDLGGTSSLDGPRMENIYSEALVNSNKAMHLSKIDDTLSGTTSITVIIRGDDLIRSYNAVIFQIL